MQKLAEDVVLALETTRKRSVGEEAREEVERYLQTRQGLSAYEKPSDAFDALDRL